MIILLSCMKFALLIFHQILFFHPISLNKYLFSYIFNILTKRIFALDNFSSHSKVSRFQAFFRMLAEKKTFYLYFSFIFLKTSFSNCSFNLFLSLIGMPFLFISSQPEKVICEFLKRSTTIRKKVKVVSTKKKNKNGALL